VGERGGAAEGGYGDFADVGGDCGEGEEGGVKAGRTTIRSEPLQLGRTSYEQAPRSR
jgi:hypothetical protein